MFVLLGLTLLVTMEHSSFECLISHFCLSNLCLSRRRLIWFSFSAKQLVSSTNNPSDGRSSKILESSIDLVLGAADPTGRVHQVGVDRSIFGFVVPGVLDTKLFFFNFMRQTYWMFREIVDWKVFRTFLNFVRVSQSFERYVILQTEVYILHIYQTFYNWLLTNLSWTISWKSPSPKSLLRSDHKPTVPQTPRKCDNIRCKYRQSYNKTIDFSMYLCIFTQLLDILHSAGDELKTDELAKRGRVESKLKEQATQEYCTVRPLEIRWPNSSE